MKNILSGSSDVFKASRPASLFFAGLLSWLQLGSLSAAPFPITVDSRIADGELVHDASLAIGQQGEYYRRTLVKRFNAPTGLDVIFQENSLLDNTCGDILITQVTTNSDQEIPESSFASLTRITNLESAYLLFGAERPSYCETYDFTDEYSPSGGIIDDINGDGIREITLTTNNGVIVIFGPSVYGQEIDILTLDGVNGFIVPGAGRFFTVGDINGDGITDIVTDSGFETGVSFRVLAGRSEPYPLVLETFSTTPSDQITSLGSHSYRTELKPAGDINGDGFDDLIVQETNTGANHVWVIYGTPQLPGIVTHLNQQQGETTITNCEGYSRCYVSAIGDFDGDNYDDIFVRIIERFIPGASPGPLESVVFYGAAGALPRFTGFDSLPAGRATLLSESNKQSSILRVLTSDTMYSVGDIDGNGVSDIATQNDASNLVLLGRAGNRPPIILVDDITPDQGFYSISQWSGESYSASHGKFATDVNGDGLSDIVTGRRVIVGRRDEPNRPPAPLGAFVRMGPDSADLVWQGAAEANIVGYRVSVNNQALMFAGPDDREVTLDNIENINDNWMSVRSVNGSGVESLPIVKPLGWNNRAVDNLRAEIYSPYSLELFWDLRQGNNTIWRNGQIHDVVDGGSYIDVGLMPGESYEYFVTNGLTPAGFLFTQLDTELMRTERINVTMPQAPEGAVAQAPGAPQNLRVLIYSPTSLELFWDAADDNEFVFQYEVSRNDEILVTRDARSYFDRNRLSGETTIYSVIAIDLDGNRSPPAEITVQADGSVSANGSGGSNTQLPTPSAQSPLAGNISPPEELRAEVYSSTSLELFWNRVITPVPARFYIVLRDGETVAEFDGTSFYDSALVAGSTHFYEIIAKSKTGELSAAASITVQLPDSTIPGSTIPGSTTPGSTTSVTSPQSPSASTTLGSRPQVNGSVISWSGPDWYQVQSSADFSTVCEGGNACQVTNGSYIVVNHTTGERFENIMVTGSDSGVSVPAASSNSTLVVAGQTLSWPDDGWYQVQSATDFSTLCEGGRQCVVAAGSYIVINHSTGQRWENIQIVPAE